MMGTTKSRSDKIGWLEQYIYARLDRFDAIDKENLVAAFCYVHKSSPKTANQILKMLVQMNKIKIKGNEISK